MTVEELSGCKYCVPSPRCSSRVSWPRFLAAGGSLGRLPLSWHSCSSPSDRYPSHAKPQPRSTGLFPCPPSPTVPSSWPSSARLVPTADRRCRSRIGRQAATTSSLARRATGSLASSPWSAAAAIPTRALSLSLGQWNTRLSRAGDPRADHEIGRAQV